LRGGLQSLPVSTGANFRGHLAFQTTAQTDQAPGMRGQQFLVDARLVIKPFGVAR
jgi:hypothetical protein